MTEVTYYHDPETTVYYEAFEAEQKAKREKARLNRLVIQVHALNPKRAHLLDGIEDPDELIRIVGGYIRASMIPLGQGGLPTGEWLLAFCLCDAHTAMRRDKARKGG